MTRIIPRLCLALGVTLTSPVQAASLAHAVSETDGSAARVTLLDERDFALGHVARQSGGQWRIGEAVAQPSDDDDGDIRLRVKLRPNRAMGRVSVAF